MYIPAWPSLNPAYFVKKPIRARTPFPLEVSRKTYFYVARSGIYHLMRSLKLENDVVLAPDYHHGNEIFAMKAADVTIRYYSVRKNLNLDMTEVERLCDLEPKPRALYVTHFIGWPQPMDQIQQFCRSKGLLLIEDCALSFMSEYKSRPLGTFGDYSVFCLYKSLPLPNGGVLVRNAESESGSEALQSCSALSVTSRSAELMLQWFRARYETAGSGLFALKRAIGCALNAGKVQRSPVGDTGFDLSRTNIGMSPVCQKLLQRFEYDWIKETRRRNFQIIEDRIRGKAQLLERTLENGVCPLFFPLLVRDKHAAAQALSQRGIETVEFWNEGDPQNQPGADAAFLRRHVLELPIHQDVTQQGAAFAADEALKLGLLL